jgi:hypothetical protein
MENAMDEYMRTGRIRRNRCSLGLVSGALGGSLVDLLEGERSICSWFLGHTLAAGDDARERIDKASRLSDLCRE